MSEFGTAVILTSGSAHSDFEEIIARKKKEGSLIFHVFRKIALKRRYTWSSLI